jgi:hypothetical protein
MHTVLVIGAGLTALAAYLLFGYAWGSGRPEVALGALLFIPC